jgi:branched-chain amino acid transport system substrate-binding protein
MIGTRCLVLARSRWGLAAAAASLVALASLAVWGALFSGSSAAASNRFCPNGSLTVLLESNFTGAGSDNGTASIGGATAGVNQINKSGGVLGCRVGIKKLDDASDYTTDLPLLEQATGSATYPLVITADFGCVGDAPYITRQHLLSISTCAQTNFATAANPTIFDTDYLAARIFSVGVQDALSKGYKKLALIVDNSQLGKDNVAAATRLVTKAGGKITDVETLDLSGIDFTSAVLRARASNPQALVDDIFGAASGHLRTEIHTAGWNIPIIGGVDDAATSFKGLVPLSYLKGDVVGPASMAFPSNPTLTKFIASLKAAGVNITSYLFGYGGVHDDLTLWAWAANKTKSLDPTTIATKLHSSGNVAIPGLVEGKTTGYTATCGEWNATGGVAIMKEGFYNEGRLPALKIVTAPALASACP